MAERGKHDQCLAATAHQCMAHHSAHQPGASLRRQARAQGGKPLHQPLCQARGRSELRLLLNGVEQQHHSSRQWPAPLWQRACCLALPSTPCRCLFKGLHRLLPYASWSSCGRQRPAAIQLCTGGHSHSTSRRLWHRAAPPALWGAAQVGELLEQQRACSRGGQRAA